MAQHLVQQIWKELKMNEEQRTDHDILICIEEKIRELKHQFDNHLRHHNIYAIALLTITGGAIGSLLIALVTLLIVK